MLPHADAREPSPAIQGHARTDARHTATAPAGDGPGAPPAPPSPAAAGPRTTGEAPLPPNDARACYDRLWRSGVTFELVEPDEARGIEMPIRLTSPIGGVEIAARDGSALHALIDCRLAIQLYAWSPALRAAGIVGLEHYSVYRPGARTPRGRRSGHASGLAIDLASYRMQDGRTIEVLTDWEERDRGEQPCPRRPHEAWASRVLRGTVCDAIERSLFHVVLTPHHDKAHQNHVHLEIKPAKNWTYVR